MKTLKKRLCVILLLIFMLLSKQDTASRKFSPDWSDSDNQVNIRTNELVASAAMDIYMNAKDRLTETLPAGIKYKKPEQRASTGNRYFDEAEAYRIILAEHEKTDGYYAIVTIFYNRILRYDKETGKYEFHDGE